MQALSNYLDFAIGDNFTPCFVLRERNSHAHPITLDNTKHCFQLVEIDQADRNKIEAFMAENLDKRQYFSDISHVVADIYGDKTLIKAKLITDPEAGDEQLLLAIHSDIEDLQRLSEREDQLFDVLWDIEAWRSALAFITITHCYSPS